MGSVKLNSLAFWGEGCPFLNVKQRIPVMLWSVSDPMSHAEGFLFSPSIWPQEAVQSDLSLSSSSAGQQTSMVVHITTIPLPFLHPAVWGALLPHGHVCFWLLVIILLPKPEKCWLGTSGKGWSWEEVEFGSSVAGLWFPNKKAGCPPRNARHLRCVWWHLNVVLSTQPYPCVSKYPSLGFHTLMQRLLPCLLVEILKTGPAIFLFFKPFCAFSVSLTVIYSREALHPFFLSQNYTVCNQPLEG